MAASRSGNAQCGNDVLIGGTGDDLLYGDCDPAQSDLTNVTRGADRFIFENGSAHDTILDFETDEDVIDLSHFKGIGGLGQVDAHASQVGADVVIDLGAAAGGSSGADVLTLAGIGLSDLGASDFVFGKGAHAAGAPAAFHGGSARASPTSSITRTRLSIRPASRAPPEGGACHVRAGAAIPDTFALPDLPVVDRRKDRTSDAGRQ